MYASSSYAFVVAGALAFAFFVASARPKVALIAFVVSCIAFSATPAFAQIDAPSIFGSWRPYIVEIVGIIVALVVGYLAELARRKMGIDIESQHREALQTALTNGAGIILAKGEDYVRGLSISTGNAGLDEGVTYVLKSVPDAAKYFGLSPAQIGEKLRAKLGLATTTPTVTTS